MKKVKKCLKKMVTLFLTFNHSSRKSQVKWCHEIEQELLYRYILSLLYDLKQSPDLEIIMSETLL
jgi:hypothetical protein